MFTQIIQCPISDICENKSANKIVKGYKICRVLIPHTCVLKSYELCWSSKDVNRISLDILHFPNYIFHRAKSKIFAEFCRYILCKFMSNLNIKYL